MKTCSSPRINPSRLQIADSNKHGSGRATAAKTRARAVVSAFSALLLLATQASAASFSFSTGDPDGKMATASRPGPGPGSGVNQETESGDDFILSSQTLINSATITGLLPAGVAPCNGPASGGTWRNHGEYVSTVAHVAEDFVAQGLISQDEKGEIVSAAARSKCGAKVR